MIPLRTMLLVLAGLGTNLMAQTSDVHSWSNLQGLTPGRQIEVNKQKGESIQGTLAGVSDESITVNAKRQTIAVPRSEVTRVRVRSARGRNSTLLGMAIGAGAGLGLGAAGGASLANSSNGGVASLKPYITGAAGGVGALVGAVVGSAVGNRGTTVYRAK